MVKFYEDLSCYDPALNVWETLPVTGDLPTPRQYATTCYAGASFYLFGGRLLHEECPTTHLYSFHFATHVWEKLTTTGKPPPAIHFQRTALVIGDRLYRVHGDAFQHTTYLELSSRRWHTVSCHGSIPNGRCHFSTVQYPNDLYLIGGMTLFLENENFMYKYNPETHTWYEREAFGISSFPKNEFCCGVIRDPLFVIGAAYKRMMQYPDASLKRIGSIHVFNFSPTLKDWCHRTMREKELNTDSLPKYLKEEFQIVSQPITYSWG